MLSFGKSFSLKSGASLAVLSLAMAGAASAHGLPSNGHFVSGQGQIGKAGQSLTVKQSSTTGIINWNSFSVGRNNSVSFNNGSGATLNHVTGGNLSTIAGQLHATGSLYLMNSAGVIVSGSGHVVTGGSFVATSGNIINSAFGTEDDKRLTATAAVVNHGTITVGGRAALFGSTVTNTGSIAGRLVSLRGTNGVDAAGTIHATGDAAYEGRISVIAKSGETKITGALTAHNADGAGGHIETSGQHVAIGGTINTGKGGSWLIDPVTLVVDGRPARIINRSLNAGTNVTLKTTAHGSSGPGHAHAGLGDIEIEDGLSWNSAATLTLDAYHSVHFNVGVDVTGAGNVVIDTNDGGTGGTVKFLNGGSLSFANLNSNLTINGAQYTLVKNIAALAADIKNDPSGDYAFANNLIEPAHQTFDGSPIATTFNGTFEGLGHRISNLKIDSGDPDVGLFADVGTEGEIDSISLDNVEITLPVRSITAGAIAGTLDGSAFEVSAQGSITVQNANRDVTLTIGGLFGTAGSQASILNASSDVSVNAYIIRDNKGESPTAIVAGGLVGDNSGTVTASSAMAHVNCNTNSLCGGAIGTNEGYVTQSFATGDVGGGNESIEGGFAAMNSGRLDQVYATGSTEAVQGAVHHVNLFSATAGGLVGENGGGIFASYAAGDVSAPEAGGLVGQDTQGARISESYATGNVTGDVAGGFIGGGGGVFRHDYWDTDWSGQTFASGGTTNNVPGITGLTTAELQSGLPAGFDRSIWAEKPSIHGGLPYLIALASSY